MRGAFRSVRQARKVAAFAPVMMVVVTPQVFAANAPSHILVPISETAYSKLSDLVPIRDLVWIGSPTQLRDYVSPDVKLNHH